MSQSELDGRYGFNERGNRLIAKSNLTQGEIDAFKAIGWKDDEDTEYIILIGGAK